VRARLLAAIGGLALLVSSRAQAAECTLWSQSRCDAQNSAAISLKTRAGSTPHAWSFDGSGRVWGYEPGMTVWSSPALGLAEGRALLVVGNYDHTVYALDAASGEPLWKFTTGGPVYATPVFFQQGERMLVLAASTDRLVYAIDAALGRQVWVHTVEDYRPTLGGARLGAPCVGGLGETDDAVFVTYWVWDRSLANSMQKGGVMAMALADGKPLWKQELGDNEMTAPVFVRRAGKGQLFVGSATGNLYALDAATGTVQWKKTELDAVRSPPAYFDAPGGPLVVAGSKYGIVRGLDAATGSERWNYRTGDRITGAPAILIEGRSARAFIGSYDQTLYELDAGSGALKWRYKARGGIYSSPAVVASGDEMVLALGWDHMLHAVSLENGSSLFSAFTGRPLWNVAGMDDSNWSSPSAARIDGSWMAYVGSYDGTLRSLPLGESDRAAPALRSNKWFYLSFPLVLIPFFSLAIVLTARERRRQSRIG
jgi:eukaryotic-like serine/threonine-protein kinase